MDNINDENKDYFYKEKNIHDDVILLFLNQMIHMIILLK